MSDYKQYPDNTRVEIISTGEQGEAFESAFGFISVAIDGETRDRFFEMNNVKFLDDEQTND